MRALNIANFSLIYKRNTGKITEKSCITKRAKFRALNFINKFSEKPFHIYCDKMPWKLGWVIEREL